MKFGSVCSGIEAASVAWHPLGWRASFVSEIEPFPRDVLAHHYPSTPLHGDFTTIQAGAYDSIDLLVGGTPCQSFSVAGLRAGLADPRGNLMLEFGSLASRLRPRWLVWENVPGVLSSNGGRDFGTFLGMLGLLGYGFAYRVLDAQFVRVDGLGRAVPQRRRRVFVVGHFGDWRRAAAVLLERSSLRGDSAPSRYTGEGLAPTLASRSRGGGGLGTDFDCDGGLIAGTLGANHGNIKAEHAWTGQMLAVPHAAISPAIKARDGKGASSDGDGDGAILVPMMLPFDTTQITSLANRSSPKPGDPCHPLARGMHAPAIAFDCKASGQSGFGIGEVASTQRAMGHADSHTNGGGHQAVMTGMQVRRLTPRECERLQGFPDDYTLILRKGKPAADGPRYKALGNSMAVNCMRWIGQRIALVDSIPQRELAEAA